MIDFNEIFKQIEDNLANADEKVNAALASFLDKIEGYRDTFKKNANGDKKTVTVDIDGEGDKKTVTVNIDADLKFDGDVKKKKGGDKLVEMAPFLDEESLHELVTEFLDGGLETEMVEFLPFLSKKDISLLLNRFKDEGIKEFKGLRLGDLFPFADDKCIDEIFIEKCMQGELDQSLLPFVSGQCLHELVVKYCEDENSTLNIDEIYPFLNKEDLNLLFKTYLKRRSKRG